MANKPGTLLGELKTAHAKLSVREHATDPDQLTIAFQHVGAPDETSHVHVVHWYVNACDLLEAFDAIVRKGAR